MHAGSPLGVVELDPLTKQAVLNTVAKGGRVLRTPMPPAAAAAAGNTIATVIHKRAGGCSVSSACLLLMLALPVVGAPF